MQACLDLVKEGWTTDDWKKFLKSLEGQRLHTRSLVMVKVETRTRVFIANLLRRVPALQRKVTARQTDDANFKGLEKVFKWINDGLMMNGSHLMVEQISKTLRMVKLTPSLYAITKRYPS